MARTRRTRRRRSPSYLRRRVRRNRIRRSSRRSRGGRVTVRNLGYLVPDKLRIAIPYALGNTLISAGADYYKEFIYRGNGIYDPEVAAGGYTPMLFTQLSTMYSRYFVRGCKIQVVTVTANNNFTCIGDAYIVANTLSTALNMTARYQALENKNVVSWGLKGVNAAETEKWHGMYRSTRKMLQDSSASSYDAGAPVNAVPGDQWYYHLIFWTADGATMWTNTYFKLKLTYWCEFQQRSSFTPSSH